MPNFQKLLFKAPSTYEVTRKRAFEPLLSLNDFLPQAFEFAYQMCFTDEGYHRNLRSGGANPRTTSEIFINTLQGKLAEYGVYQQFKTKGIQTPLPDTATYGKGLWDNGDSVCYGKTISIKSGAHFANLMLLETKDWDEEGNYIPDGNSYDFFIFCRIKPDGKTLLGQPLASHSVDREALAQLAAATNWEFDIAGCIGKGELKFLIENGFVLPQKALLNGKIQMDASNYYVQSGDMHSFDDLLKKLDLIRQA